MFLPFEVATKSWESPTFQSTTEHSVSSAETKHQEPSASSIHTHSSFIGSMMSCSRAMSECPGLNGGKASDWLRHESRFHPKSFAPFSKRYPFGALQLPLRALQLHIPSRLEGKWGVVDRKAGGLADAQHILLTILSMSDCHGIYFLIIDRGVSVGTNAWEVCVYLISGG